MIEQQQYFLTGKWTSWRNTPVFCDIRGTWTPTPRQKFYTIWATRARHFLPHVFEYWFWGYIFDWQMDVLEKGSIFCDRKCLITLQWRHIGHDGGSNHQPHHCLLNVGAIESPTIRFMMNNIPLGPGYEQSLCQTKQKACEFIYIPNLDETHFILT